MVPRWFVPIVHPHKKFEIPIIVTFKSFIKENIDSIKTHRYIHDTSLCQSSFLSVRVNAFCPYNKMWVLDFNRPCSYFCLFAKVVLLKLFIFWKSISGPNFTDALWLVQVLHPPFWNGWRCGIKNYVVEVTFNCMSSLLNFIKNLPTGSEADGWGQTEWWSHKPIYFPLGGKGGRKEHLYCHFPPIITPSTLPGFNRTPRVALTCHMHIFPNVK
jgi:hypothetical protein